MINFNDYSFHDSEILEVTHNETQQLIEFSIYYPTDWENNVSEKMILKFIDVTRYYIDEIPHAGTSTILDIKVKPNLINHTAFIPTTMGSREIDFQRAELYKLN